METLSALHSAFPNIDEQPRMPTHWKALLIRVCYPVTDISAVEIRSRVGRRQFRLRCCLSTSQFLPHGASWTWPRGGGWAGGAPCPGAGPCGAGPSVLVRVPPVLVRVPAAVVRVAPLVVGGTAAVLLEAAVPRQTARAALPSVGGPLAVDQV